MALLNSAARASVVVLCLTSTVQADPASRSVAAEGSWDGRVVAMLGSSLGGGESRARYFLGRSLDHFLRHDLDVGITFAVAGEFDRIPATITQIQTTYYFPRTDRRWRPLVSMHTGVASEYQPKSRSFGYFGFAAGWLFTVSPRVDLSCEALINASNESAHPVIGLQTRLRLRPAR